MDSEKLAPDHQIAFGSRKVPIWMVILITTVIVLSLGLIALGAVLGLHVDSQADKPQDTSKWCLTTDCLRETSRMMRAINNTVNPCDDFYQYACGGWMGRSKLLPWRSSRTILSDVQDINQNKLNRLLSQPVVRNDPKTSEYKLKNLFRSCVNQYENEKVKGTALLTHINNFLGGWWVTDKNVANSFDFQTVFERAHVDYWVNALFSYTVATDEENNKLRVIEIDLGGLGMSYPYYLRKDTVGIVKAYKQFITNAANLFVRDSGIQVGPNDVATFVNDIYDFESKLAGVINGSQPSQNPHDKDNRVKIKDLGAGTGTDAAQTYKFDWLHFFQHMFGNAITGETQIVLLEKQYLQMVFQMIGTYSQSDSPSFKRAMSNYLVWRVMQAYLQDLSWEYVHANREFYVARTGRTGFLGTWRFCFNFVTSKMGTAVGSLFVRDHFSDESKDKIHEIIALIKTTMSERLQYATWMDTTTRNTAKGKIARSIEKLGYPDLMMKDDMLDAMYDQLNIGTSYFDNVINIAKWEKVLWSRRLAQGEDRRTWIYDTYDVVAHFYNPWNELIIPAGMMQFPLYTNRVPAFWKFGSIGVIMAQQLMHAIDYWGSWYDSSGDIANPTGWWSDKTRQGYNQARKCVVNYYTNKTVGPYRVAGYPYGVKVIIHADSYSNRAVAETGGVRMAYYAYQKYKTQYGSMLAPGLGRTTDQSFFISYAQSNCFIRRDAYAFRYAMSGRVPENLQTNGALSQMVEFQRAFNCPAGSNMNAKTKCGLFP